jgi:PleD family two-component response regulator
MPEIRAAKILFITEDRDEGKLVQYYLGEERNDTVITCNPQHQALSDFGQAGLDLILLTAYPQAFKAFQLYQALRTVPGFEQIPLIFWRFLETPSEFYPMAQKVGAAGCIEYVFDIEQALLVARDTVIAGGIFYPG